MSSVLKDTLKDMPRNDIQYMKDTILWRIAVNLAEIADQLAEMNGYKIDSIYDEENADALEAAEKRIAELEAQLPKEGAWIDEQRGRWIYAKCNLCGKVQDVRSNYCPNCGAKMKGENDADN